MPRLVFEAGNLDSTTVDEDNPTLTLDNNIAFGYQEKLNNELDAAFRIVYTSQGTNHWTIIKDTQWIRSARFRFYISDQENPNAYIVLIKSANTVDPVGDWTPRFMSWDAYGRNPGEDWSGVDGANSTGDVGGEVLVGDILGWKDAGVKSMLRKIMRIYESAGTHVVVGFSLQAKNETVGDAISNMVRITDERNVSANPYMRVTYGQPTLSRSRGFGKRMLTRL